MTNYLTCFDQAGTSTSPSKFCAYRSAQGSWSRPSPRAAAPALTRARLRENPLFKKAKWICEVTCQRECTSRLPV